MTPKTVDEYIEQYPEDRQVILKEIRSRIKEVLPEAEEIIKYGMPTYFQKKNLIHFSNAKNHIGLYPTPEAILAFTSELVDYKTSKGAIQFPISKPIPYDLIEKIAIWRLKEVIG